MAFLKSAYFLCSLFGLIILTSPLRAEAPLTPSLSKFAIAQFGQPPTIPKGPLSEELEQAVQIGFVDSIQNGTWGEEQADAFQLIVQSKDPRLVWIISDMMRFIANPDMQRILHSMASVLLEKPLPDHNHWGMVTDHLIAWNIPEPPGYLKVKKVIFTTVLPEWDKLFVPGDIDWRHVSWGGVLIDDRGFDQTDDPCNCIPAADNPKVTSASEADWLEETDIIFGIRLNGQARAYPRQIMEVREMVNDTLGGRDLAIPYCTLCGAAQAYFTDDLPDGIARPVLRTSGLLIRSNKVMFDLNSFSVFDTFLGHAVTGPLHEKGLKLKQASVITTTWGAWKKAHPDTTVLAEELALGRDFDFRNNRDADGPIFPVGDVDPRLPIHEDIIGIVSQSGTPIAFVRTKAMVALQQGQEISFENIRLILSAGGIKAIDPEGRDLGSHQAFWFAWSQFHPKTELWDG